VAVVWQLAVSSISSFFSVIVCPSVFITSLPTNAEAASGTEFLVSVYKSELITIPVAGAASTFIDATCEGFYSPFSFCNYSMIALTLALCPSAKLFISSVTSEVIGIFKDTV